MTSDPAHPAGWPAPAPPPARRSLSLRTILSLAAGAVAIAAVAMLAAGVMAVEHEWVQAADVAKVTIALLAAVLALGDALRIALRVELPGAVGKAVFVALGAAAFFAYFNGFHFTYPKFYHRWEQYHAYVGAKYFPELGYDRLYHCTAVAEDEIGEARFTKPSGAPGTIDLRAELRRGGVTIRDLEGDHLLVPVEGMIARAEECKAHFSPERWESYKRDITFFRTESDRGYWEDMQKDHGFTMPPAWTIAGRFFTALHEPSVGYLQLLGALDIFYLLAMFVAIGWAFGARAAGVSAVFWGCQAIAPFLWTGGAFLRQDWLFYLVLSACLLKKGRPALAGAALAYASLLRIFPGYAAAGLGLFVVAELARTRRLAPRSRRLLLGAALAAAVIVPASVASAGASAYPQFYRRAITYQETPLTNHMGLAVLVSQDLGTGPGSGRMELAKDPKQIDPFATWRRIRTERYERFAPAAYLIVALSVAGFFWVAWRLRTPFIAACLGQLFIVLGAQLTCFNYPFLVLSAPLVRANRALTVPLCLFAVLTQVVAVGITYNDVKYTAQSALALLLCLGLVAAFRKRARWRRKADRHASVYR